MSIDLKNIPRSKSKKPVKKEETKGFFDFMNRDIKLFGSGMKDKTKERFYSDLHILLSSGIDIKTALELITEDQKKKSDKALFEDVGKKVIAGKSLSDALHDTGKFSNYEYFSMKIGEESGRITEVLSELAAFYVRKIKQKRQLVNAFSYPVLVLFTAITAVTFMMKFVVPMFKDVFARFHGKLPYITEVIIKISGLFSSYFWIVVLLTMSVIVLLYSQRRKIWYRRISTAFLIKLPIFGKIIRQVYIVRFCQAMALLISSRTPMLRAIQLVKNMISFYPFEKALEKIDTDIMHGKSLNESMKQFPIFDKRMISLIRVAEEVNQLDKIFERLNKQYSEELDHQISLMAGLLEPLMIIFVGLLVGTILVAMYLPLFQLSTSIY